MSAEQEQLVLIVEHPVLRKRLLMVAHTVRLEVVETAVSDVLTLPTQPIAIVVELELSGAITAITTWKATWPDCFVAAAIAIPDQELWIAALAAGCDLVANRGALPQQLQQKLKDRHTDQPLITPGVRLQAKRITNPGDGLVGRVPDAPDGAIVIFRVGERLCAFRDVCPHAGYSLADGALDGSVITCPQHGSRFDICTGERLRGPSDYPVQTYKVIEENKALYVEI